MGQSCGPIIKLNVLLGKRNTHHPPSRQSELIQYPTETMESWSKCEYFKQSVKRISGRLTESLGM